MSPRCKGIGRMPVYSIRSAGYWGILHFVQDDSMGGRALALYVLLHGITLRFSSRQESVIAWDMREADQLCSAVVQE